MTRSEAILRNLVSFLSENRKPVKALARIRFLRQAIQAPESGYLASANRILDQFRTTLEVDVCYLMDRSGTTVASSNRFEPDSFMGENFSFRPYFQDAVQGRTGFYLAVGTTSGKRGAYYSAPVYGSEQKGIIGVVVIKASIDLIEKDLNFSPDEIGLVVDPSGIIFISNKGEWLFHALTPLSPPQIAEVKASRQFGEGPWPHCGLDMRDGEYAVDPDGTRYIVHYKDIPLYPGWRIYHLKDIAEISRKIAAPLYRITGPVVLALCILVGLSVALLYRKASQELGKRKQAENALRQSEERYRSLYHNTPAMLHSIDTRGNLLSVSEHWLEAMGYQKEEVIGRPLVSFFTEESKQYAQNEVFPAFFRSGLCKDVPYQFVKKDGEVIDVLLSAISERDEAGRSVRSLAVSIDVTERKKAELALKQAKEELSRYSRELERKVRKRTREITNIFKYIPAAVYLKDKEYRYTLINSRFEKMFNVTNEMVIAKTDFDLFPDRAADLFRNREQEVMEGNRYQRFEKEITLSGVRHTYLSVIFPIYDDAGDTSGVCGILTDITALKKAQDQLRRLSGSIMENQERERTAIARELHDELGQVLTALRMDAVWLSEQIRKEKPEAATRALTMCELIDKTIESVRDLSIRLRPGVLDDLGLVDALEGLTSEFERRTGITCIFEHTKIPDIGNTIATALYRIAQESFTNVARHAAATRVETRLAFDGSAVTLLVEDDGIGFNVSHLSDIESLGIAGMRERATLAGGELTVRSRRNNGTTLVCRIPIENRDRRAS